MGLKARFANDMKAAMKSRDKVKLSVIRMLLKDIKKAKISAVEYLSE